MFTAPVASRRDRGYNVPGPWPVASRRDRGYNVPGPWPVASRRDRYNAPGGTSCMFL